LNNLKNKPNLNANEQARIKELERELKEKQVGQKENNYKLWLGIGCGVLGMSLVGALEFDQPSELVIENYPNLKRIYREVLPIPIFNVTKVVIRNCSQLEHVNLNRLKNNQELILNDLPSLKYLDCGYNKLTNLDLQSINIDKLEELYLNNNNFAKQDLSFLSHLTSLKNLWLGTNLRIRIEEGRERVQQGIYNRFYGSLKFLQELTTLKELNINDSDLESGLEYLPNSIVSFDCSAGEREDAKVKIIKEKLEKYKFSSGTYASALEN
ncbi:12405_t:CDS:2, partial [Funneliformis geosporum]